MFDRAFRSWFEKALGESRIGLRRALSRLAWSDDLSPAEQLQYAGWKLIEWRDFRAPWRREPFDREHEIDRLADHVRKLAGLTAQCPRPHDELYKSTGPIRELAAVQSRGAKARRQPDVALSLRIALITPRRSHPSYSRGATGAARS